MWTNDYDSLLVEWANLREQISSLSLAEALLVTQQYWDKAPICNPYFHITEPDTWPTPWQLLADNCYSELAKALGICYTLLLAEHDEVNSLHIIETDNYVLVQVNGGQYYLNDEPGSITEGPIDLPIRHIFDCADLKIK